MHVKLISENGCKRIQGFDGLCDADFSIRLDVIQANFGQIRPRIHGHDIAIQTVESFGFKAYAADRKPRPLWGDLTAEQKMPFEACCIYSRPFPGLKDAVRRQAVNAPVGTLGVPPDKCGKDLRDFLDGRDIIAMVRLVVRLRPLEIGGLVVDIIAAI